MGWPKLYLCHCGDLTCGDFICGLKNKLFFRPTKKRRFFELFGVPGFRRGFWRALVIAGCVAHVAMAEVLPSQPSKHVPAKHLFLLDHRTRPAPGLPRGSRRNFFDARGVFLTIEFEREMALVTLFRTAHGFRRGGSGSRSGGRS